MSPIPDRDTFLQTVQAFGERLDAATDFDTLLKLWRETNLPYTYEAQDPLSDEYRAEVLDLYRRMTSLDYDVANEMTSTKQSAEQFEAGYPWISHNLQVVAEEYLKVAQGLAVIQRCRTGSSRIIEFGSGWGNLAIPLAKAGQEVTVVDIDHGFLDRLQRWAERENVIVQSLHGDFVEVARLIEQRYDFAVFQASFHHCLNFVELVQTLREHVLAPKGRIVFLSEPIFETYPFPWGLRFDGESLWAITRNQWLELGFERNFFVDFMLRSGFLVSTIPSIPGYLGEGWLAHLGTGGIAFEDWVLPDLISDTFHASEAGTGFGRFSKATSELPSLAGSPYTTYHLSFHNFGRAPLRVAVRADEAGTPVTLEPDGGYEAAVVASKASVTITSDLFSPRAQGASGDTRELGVALRRVTLA